MAGPPQPKPPPREKGPRKPLSRGEPMTRTGFKQKSREERPKPKPRTPIKSKRSERNLEFEAELDDLTPLIESRARGECEFKIPGVCSGGLDHRHHRRQGRHRDANTYWNVYYICWKCHLYAHWNPPEHLRTCEGDSYENGWLIRMGVDPKTVPVIIPRRKSLG